MELGSSYLSDRMILALTLSQRWGQMQPFACKLEVENMSRSDDPSARMILALGSSSFHVNRALKGLAKLETAEIFLQTQMSISLAAREIFVTDARKCY